MSEPFQAGVAEIDITPDVGLPMDGYAARQGVSTGIHDPLLAQTLVLANGPARAAIVTLDVLAVSAPFADALRQSLAATLATTPDAILICPSHTHCGPSGLQNWFPIGTAPSLDPALMAMVHQRIMIAARRALKQMTPARLVCSRCEVPGIGGDRNQPGRTHDDTVTALRFDKPDGTSIAILFHYACHPTVLGPETRDYSADFPGAARHQIRTAYPQTICMYLNGAAGNISPRYFRRDRSFNEAQRLGKRLGEHVIALLEQPQSVTTGLSYSRQEIDLPLRSFTTELPQQGQLTGDDRFEQARAEGMAIQAQLSKAFHGRSSQHATLHALHIGPWRLLGVPGEPFNELAMAVRAQSSWALIIGYANDYLGYFPTQEAIDTATYEALSTPYDARALERIRACLLRDLL